MSFSNSFAQAASRQNGAASNLGRTTNGAATNLTSHSACVDFFAQAPAMRGKTSQAIILFNRAYAENPDIALRTLLFLRDVRGGAGERQLFRDILQDLSLRNPNDAARIVMKTPEVGRWDDLFSAAGSARDFAFALIDHALLGQDDKLAAKWMPRKGPNAEALRKHMGLSSMQYRKIIVGLSQTVEQQMCAREWDKINFSHVPSVAAKTYQKAFSKRAADAYAAYRDALKKGDPKVKVNAGAIFPHDVIVGLRNGIKDVAEAQWKALPDYLGTDDGILPLIDLSGSMTCRLGGINDTVTCRDVSMALGLYIAERQRGAFHNLVMTFSSDTRVVTLADSMTLAAKLEAIDDRYAGSTNIEAAFRKILEIALLNRVAPSAMPKKLLILSDMEFDSACVGTVNPGRGMAYAQILRQIAQSRITALDMLRYQYVVAGYVMPQIVFWNLNARLGNNPVTVKDDGIAMVGGYSPALLKSILACKDFSPENVMLEAVMGDRYKLA